ncbi:hypothetical protein MNBD_ALPHA06-266 [hydrothermal vent metagenome]|uniref:HIG1 domain-containing protein n=1 Tax=hydrothermal vent metagenome TaxID=652676 RepID=A0A3B0S252_9ZZZZ
MAINILIFVALALVAGTLMAGMFNMARGGKGEGARSNKLMRLRVILQAVAIVLLMIGFFLKAQAGS